MRVVVKHHDLVVPAVFGSDQPAGELIFLGDLPAVTLEPMKSGVATGVAVGAVVDGPRQTGSAWTQGTVVYWDEANRRFTTTSTGNKRVGIVVSGDVGPSVTRVLVLMDR
jgi:predicted RecA/RadA family phage recombinase